MGVPERAAPTKSHAGGSGRNREPVMQPIMSCEKQGGTVYSDCSSDPSAKVRVKRFESKMYNGGVSPSAFD